MRLGLRPRTHRLSMGGLWLPAVPGVPLPVISIAATSANKAEGDAGSTAFTFTVTRTGDVTGSSSATWTVSGSGANPANAADFTGGTFPTGTVSFAATETSKVITVNVAGDTDVEPDEGFTVTLSAPSGCTIGTATATGTIQDDDTVSGPSYIHNWTLSDDGGDTTTSAGFITGATDRGSAGIDLTEATAGQQFAYVTDASAPGDHGNSTLGTQRLASTDATILANVNTVGTWQVAVYMDIAPPGAVTEYIIRGNNTNQHRFGVSIYNTGATVFVGNGGTSFVSTGTTLATATFTVFSITFDGTNMFVRRHQVGSNTQIYTAAISTYGTLTGWSIGARQNVSSQGPTGMRFFEAAFFSATDTATVDANAAYMAAQHGVTF